MPAVMKSYYIYVAILLVVSACGDHMTSAQAVPQRQVATGGTDYSYIYSEMATSGSCRTNLSAGGGLSSKCTQ